MKTAIGVAALVLVLAGAGAVGLSVWPIGTAVTLAERNGDARRGAYLARMAGCIACHTDVKGGGKPLAGGLALKTRFGTFFSPNLTRDADHGIGGWSIEDFARAVRQGVSPDGDPYYPAFPYPFYAVLSDKDIADLWAAFRTVPAVAEPSKPHELSFPYGFRSGVKLWRAAFLSDAGLAEAPDRSDAWRRGRYIVKGPAHCGACHTPRNFAGARDAELALHGSDALPDGGKSPPITTAALKRNGWTHNDIAYALKTGLAPDGDAFGGSMGDVVRHGTSFLTAGDRKAIATYLLDEDEEQP
ncbi:cytochrome c [Rhodobium gokarnense]|uniref:Mono/diheme cytochrome c family protein n=1 Tax=Rhodobium gokarnense TaxID=364296 RepID=A0ABT3HGJ3_9HYPH|nr:cytochrome c [Rhodobium gokarnense]MCW2309391.1 mono/diheme cytochrome c family protein [Rhodobium gokarnense]